MSNTNILQPVDKDNQYTGKRAPTFSMIDNYVYLYHTDTLVVLPTYPETIADAMSTNYQQTTPLSSSAPIYSFVNAGPRQFTISLPLHRDMFNEINIHDSNLKLNDLTSSTDDYLDVVIRQLQAMAVPNYHSGSKMVDPPLVAVRFGKDLFCKGVITQGVTVTYSGPILRNDKYAEVTVEFTICEVDAYDAESVLLQGSFRGLSQDLTRRIYKKAGGK